MSFRHQPCKDNASLEYFLYARSVRESLAAFKAAIRLYNESKNGLKKNQRNNKKTTLYNVSTLTFSVDAILG